MRGRVLTFPQVASQRSALETVSLVLVEVGADLKFIVAYHKIDF